ncbi:MAG: hypothetical protein JRI98_10670 [Deltaproteobacteria bacterium]|nr:hypothetical protein [Deltaproteobacteria bacterium]MBW2687339.1 hypothetical protein [Deltaproteobacteria bacterium]
MGRSKGPESALEVVGVVPVAMVLVETKDVFQFGDGLGKSIVESGAMVVPDIFDGLEDLLFHDEHTVQLTV